MDRALIQGIKRLRVLTPYDYDNMDELVQDLTSALEESSSSAQHRHPPQRKWCSKKALLPLDTARLPGSVSSSTTCQTTRSVSAVSGDDSESSLEGRALPRMLDAAQSDSDDLLQRLCAWRHRQSNAAESDSLNENCLPTTVRPQRRKRKLKRMAVDLEPPSGDSSQGLPDISKPVALSHPKGTTAGGSQQLCGPPAARAAAGSLCGKRKRSMRERSLESVGHRRSSECCDDMELEESKPHHGVKKRKNLDFVMKFKVIQRVEAGEKTELVETGEDCDDEFIDDTFRELSPLFTAAVPPEVSADDFVEADCNAQAVASLADEDIDIVAAVAGTQDAQADSSSGDEDRLDEAAAARAYSAAEVAAAFGLIRRCCGDMEETELSHLDSLNKIEASIFNFISKTKKQAKISNFFSRK
ncbi:hypothetical protein HPB52_004755 [Rhipicephalus sanguineus]|uniref:Uncharacterized protein n=1 Tax=Rhipicephalus sanguineus TaxID=34632 RepID=A0A9D4Q953_RHISA|nr:hypothetical protein HPB52_004755 [Rhipicephalus sanguineus]